MEKTGVLDRDS